MSHLDGVLSSFKWLPSVGNGGARTKQRKFAKQPLFPLPIDEKCCRTSSYACGSLWRPCTKRKIEQKMAQTFQKWRIGPQDHQKKKNVENVDLQALLGQDDAQTQEQLATALRCDRTSISITFE